jgi:hypothetical protein
MLKWNTPVGQEVDKIFHLRLTLQGLRRLLSDDALSVSVDHCFSRITLSDGDVVQDRETICILFTLVEMNIGF